MKIGESNAKVDDLVLLNAYPYNNKGVITHIGDRVTLVCKDFKHWGDDVYKISQSIYKRGDDGYMARPGETFSVSLKCTVYEIWTPQAHPEIFL